MSTELPMPKSGFAAEGNEFLTYSVFEASPTEAVAKKVWSDIILFFSIEYRLDGGPLLSAFGPLIAFTVIVPGVAVELLGLVSAGS